MSYTRERCKGMTDLYGAALSLWVSFGAVGTIVHGANQGFPSSLALAAWVVAYVVVSFVLYWCGRVWSARHLALTWR